MLARLQPTIASDLVSAVELGPPDAFTPGPETGPPPVSPSLVRALQGAVAGAVEPLEPRRLISLRPAALALAVLIAVASITGVALYRWPELGRGLTTLARRPTRFEGAATSAAPLVGDLRMSYEFPAYT